MPKSFFGFNEMQTYFCITYLKSKKAKEKKVFKVKLIFPIVVLISFMSVTGANAQGKNAPHSVILAEDPTTDITPDHTSDKDVGNKIFTLYQNEKTQFANLTKVRFDLFIGAGVILNVVDGQGKIVEKLIDGSMEPGCYSVYYKSADEEMPRELSYMIEVDGVSESKSILIFK
jgi:hypothetical protein